MGKGPMIVAGEDGKERLDMANAHCIQKGTITLNPMCINMN